MALSVNKALSAIIFLCLALSQGLFILGVYGNFDYKDALTKSLIFLEAQRSGKLPPNHRPSWRGDSGLDDGKLVNVDLTGGYYDAGDNVKYGLPMAFTVTTLAWAAKFYRNELQASGELQNVHSAIRWGTDYFLKCTVKKKTLFVEVGDPHEDHKCWVRPESMHTPRTVKKIDQNTPGSEHAAETAAAMASSSIIFRTTDRPYARRLLNKAKLLFEFAKTKKRSYDGECPFYCSVSGYNDELLWAATWLYTATKKPAYLKFINEESISANVAEFSWDLKYAGNAVLLSDLYFQGEKTFEQFKKEADYFMCANLPDSIFKQHKLTPGGMLHIRDGAGAQYVTSTAMLFSIYGDILAKNNGKVVCGSQQFEPARLISFAKQQIDYLLGSNPLGRSYMVGFGNNSPKQAHHRGASVPASIGKTVVDCGSSFNKWYHPDAPNPNELTGAIVGGPDANDNFVDKRSDSTKTEPCTYVNSAIVGVLAKLANHKA